MKPVLHLLAFMLPLSFSAQAQKTNIKTGQLLLGWEGGSGLNQKNS